MTNLFEIISKVEYFKYNLAYKKIVKKIFHRLIGFCLSEVLNIFTLNKKNNPEWRNHIKSI